MGRNFFTYRLKGSIYKLFRNPQDLLEMYRSVLEKYPHKVGLYPLIVKLHVKAKRDILELDLLTLKRALFLRPTDKVIVMATANWYLKKNMTHAEAIRIYQTALKFDPSNISLLNVLGSIYLKDAENYHKGLDIYNKLISLGQTELLDDEHLVRAFLRRNSEKLYGTSSLIN